MRDSVTLASKTVQTAVLPPVETTPLILIRFTAKTPAELLLLVQERLVQGGLHIVDQDVDDEGRVLLGLTAHQEELEAEAQHIRLKKRTNESDIIEYLRVKTKAQFYSRSSTDASPRDHLGLFSCNDWSLLAWSILDDINVMPKGHVSTNLSRRLDAYKVVYRRYGGGELLSSLLRAELGERSDCLRHVLQAYDFVDLVTPVHQPRVRNAIWSESCKHWIPPLQAIRDYYGEEIAFYFAWMEFITRWLCFPAVLGVIVYVARLYRQTTVDNDEYAAAYGLLCFMWSILCAIFWERQENRLSYDWGTFATSDFQKQRFFTKRPEFVGELRISPITGQLEAYYPPYKRRLKMMVSALITCILLGVAFAVMILSLNLQGYINPQTDPKRWMDNRHPFHFPSLSILAEEGQIFDAKSQWVCFVPVVLHIACIFTMNLIYRWIAEHLTDWENHETHRSHRNSLVLKRFLFEAFDCYVALFYLAFYERDVHRLRLELISVFSIDTFRRLLLECVVPMILQKLTHKHTKKDAQHKKDDATNQKPYSRLIEEAERDEYEQFDDYMEIVIELGYVTLFAAAFPLASIIAIVSNLVEMHADCFKLAFLCRRPRSIRSDGLGMWKNLIRAIIWLSALTNCLIFGFTSDQLMQFLPTYYFLDDNDKTRLTQNSWVVIFIIFGLERVLIYLGLAFAAVIPAVPEDVMDQLEKRYWIREKESEKWRQEDRERRSSDLRSRSDLSTVLAREEFHKLTSCDEHRL